MAREARLVSHGPSPVRRTRRRGLSLLLGLSLAVLGPAGAGAEALLSEVRDEDRDALETLASFPPEVREAALEAAVHPQLVARVHELQRRSSGEFRELVEELPREEQEKVWSLVRYPELVAEIVDGGPKSEDRLRAIAEHYPESVRDPGVELGRSRHALLVRIHALDARSERLFEQGLEGHPPEAAAAMRSLVARPEALDLLTEHMHMTVLLGGAYGRDPEAVSAELARLHDEVAERERVAQEDWREELAEDPEAREELEQARREYAEEYGVEQARAEEEAYEDEPETRSRSNVQVFLGVGPPYAYPYWFGYPSWYVSVYPGYPSYYYWHPLHLHPVYWGLHWSSGGHFALSVGFPSFHFAHWYFSRPIHHHHYPHLSHRILRHREHHPRIHRGGYRVANRWVRTHQHRGGRDWLRDDGQRHRRLREYGHLEHQYRRERQRHPGVRTTRYDIVRRSPDRYPHLRERMRPSSRQRHDDFGRARQRERYAREGGPTRIARRTDGVRERSRGPAVERNVGRSGGRSERRSGEQPFERRRERERWRDAQEPGDPRTRDSLIRDAGRERGRAPGDARSRQGRIERSVESREGRGARDRSGPRERERDFGERNVGERNVGQRGDPAPAVERRRERTSLLAPRRDEPTRGGFERPRSAPRQQIERRSIGGDSPSLGNEGSRGESKRLRSRDPRTRRSERADEPSQARERPTRREPAAVERQRGSRERQSGAVEPRQTSPGRARVERRPSADRRPAPAARGGRREVERPSPRSGPEAERAPRPPQRREARVTPQPDRRGRSADVRSRSSRSPRELRSSRGGSDRSRAQRSSRGGRSGRGEARGGSRGGGRGRR